MTLYTRHQLVLVLLLVGAAGGGLAVDHWRRTRPALAEWLETLDRAERAPAPSAPRRPARSQTDTPRPPRVVRERADAPVDVNRASAIELTALPGIGPALAARIVAARPFAEIDELRRVRGLRRATLERLRPLVTTAAAATTVE
jgi:DNA uptake protein ComE-like DNA-binding protein